MRSMGVKSVRPTLSDQGWRAAFQTPVEVSVQSVQGSSVSRRYGWSSYRIEDINGHGKMLNLICNQRNTK